MTGRKRKRAQRFIKLLLVVVLLYLFLVSIGLMGAAFKGFGKKFAENLICTTRNPVVGLFIGLLVTSIIQSSSTTTSMVVGFVAGGVLTIENAIPIVMGANIGTTITSIIVSIGHITRREEFRRAFSGALINDIFKIMVVLVLFPLELATGYLRRVATQLAFIFKDIGGLKLSSPVKVMVRPAVDVIKSFFYDLLAGNSKIACLAMLIFALVLLFCALFFLVKVLRSLMAQRTEIVFYNVLGKGGIRGMLLGAVITAIIQSSSVTTSILVPLLAAGVITIEMAFPVTLGADLGTTITALLASLAGGIEGTVVAFAHVAFNATGVAMIYPVKRIRKIPIALARRIGYTAARHRIYALLYVFTLFFLIPTVVIVITMQCR